VDHLEALVAADPSQRPVDLVVVVAEQFGVVVHPRSIGRALARRAEARARQGALKTG
jgi:dienelactone hydrolase